MAEGKILIFTGDGHGKSPAALGMAMQRAALGNQVVIIQFLKGKGLADTEFVKRLEPEIKLFRFEKSQESFDQRTEEEKTEEIINIRNGLNFARKVLTTGECDLIVLDEVLGLVDNEIISVSDLRDLMELRGETNVIMTGISMSNEVCTFADEISKIETVKFKTY